MAKGIAHIDPGDNELTLGEFTQDGSHELQAGTSFPLSPSEPDLYYRTDLHKWYIYDDTDWVELTGTNLIEDYATISGSEPYLRLTDSDETPPGGDFRIWVNVDTLYIQGRNAGDDGWDNMITMPRGSVQSYNFNNNNITGINSIFIADDGDAEGFMGPSSAWGLHHPTTAQGGYDAVEITVDDPFQVRSGSTLIFQTDLSGNSTIYGNLNPDSGNTNDIGAAGAEWKDAYIQGTIYMASDQSEYVTSDGTILTFGIGSADMLHLTDAALYPETDSTLELGLTGQRWSNIYGDAVYTDLIDTKDITAPGDLDIANQILTADNQHDVSFFGVTTAQSGAFNNIVKIFGGSNQGRSLSLYQVVSGDAYVVSTYNDLILSATGDGSTGIGVITSATDAFYPTVDSNTHFGKTGLRWATAYIDDIVFTTSISGGGTGHDQFSDKAADEHVTHSTVNVTAGDGLTGGGAIDTTRTLTLGTPGTNTQGTSNAVTTSSHTHAWTHTSRSNWDSAYSHISESGASHTYINQSVVSGASPTFVGLTLSDELDMGDANIVNALNIIYPDASSYWLQLSDTGESGGTLYDAGVYWNTSTNYLEFRGYTGASLNYRTVQKLSVTTSEIMAHDDFLSNSDNGYDIGGGSNKFKDLYIGTRGYFSNTEDVSSSSLTGALIIGDAGGGHMAIDANEIMAKSSPSAAGILYLQAEGGGSVYIGNHATMTTARLHGNTIIDNLTSGSSINSPTLYIRGNYYDTGDHEIEANFTLIGGTNPYLRLQVSDDGATPVSTTIANFYSESVVFTGHLLSTGTGNNLGGPGNEWAHLYITTDKYAYLSSDQQEWIRSDGVSVFVGVGNSDTLTIGTTNFDIGGLNLTNSGTGHDVFTDFVSNEHIDHSSVLINVGTGLDGGGNLTTTRTITVDFSEFTDMTDAVDGTVDEMILLDAGAERRKRLVEINLSQFNDDLSYGVGTVTAVNNGNGMNFTNITSSGSIVLGTPGTTTQATSNAVSTSSHTHAWTHTSSANWDSAYAHLGTTGANHTYINQSVTSTSTPLFDTIAVGGFAGAAKYIDIGTATGGKAELGLWEISQSYGFRILYDGTSNTLEIWNHDNNSTGSAFLTIPRAGAAMNIAGALLPVGTYDLGSASAQWDDLYLLDAILWDDGNEFMYGDGDQLLWGVGGTSELILSSTSLRPNANAGLSLGSDASEFNDLWIDGTGYFDAITMHGTAAMRHITATSDGAYNIGTTDVRFGYIYCDNIEVGDIIMKNKMRIIEDGPDAIFMNPDGVPIMRLTKDGDLIVKGKIRTGDVGDYEDFKLFR